MRNLTRAQIGRALVLPLFLLVEFTPLALEPIQHRLLSIVVAVVCLWISEAMPIAVTALLIAPLMVVSGVTDPKTAFAPYADPLLFLFYGSFFIAAAMQRHGLDRRIANAIVDSPLVGGKASRARIALMTAGLLLSMWVSNTAATAILVPILLGMLAAPAVTALPSEIRQMATVGGLLAIAYACSVGGMGTLVGTPPNMIAVRMLSEVGTSLSFLEFSMIGLPAALVLTLLIYGLFAKRYPAPSVVTPKAISAQGPMSRGERLTAISLSSAVFGFVVPPTLSALEVPGAEAINRALPTSAVAMLAAGLLFWLHDEKADPVLPWSEARKVDWGIIMLFGGGISLGSQMFHTGLADALGRGFIAATGVSDLWTLTALAVGFTILFTEVCSNTATANMVIPLVIGVTSGLHVSAVPPVLGVALAASCAFMMPISTGPNAVVYGTGEIPLPRMMRIGMELNVLCGVVLFVMLRILCPLYGWD